MELLRKLVNSDIVLMATFATLALWSVSLYLIWQEKKRKKKTYN